MNVKRYFAGDMHEAMQKIKTELGAEAVVLTSKSFRKKGVKGFLSKPMVEVTVAYEPTGKEINLDGTGQIQTRPAPELTPVLSDDERFNQLDRKLSELNSMMKNVSGRLATRNIMAEANFSEDIKPLLGRLLESEVQEELAYAIATEAQSIVENVGGHPYDIVRQIIKQCLGEPEPIRVKKFKQNVFLFIGATGVGKTTSLVKLAANYAVSGERKVGLINGDTYRIAAQDQLRTYSDIMGVPLEVIYSPEEVSTALKLMEKSELVFIDTAGKKPFDENHKDDVKKLMELTNPDEIFLCISASTSNRACQDIIQNYAFIPGYKLIVTKINKITSQGLLLNACYYSGRPLAYVANGQNVPDDICPADIGDIACNILGEC